MRLEKQMACVLSALSMLSACSEVHLSYGLAGSQLSLIGEGPTAPAALANLQILAQVHSERLALDQLRLQIRLRHLDSEQPEQLFLVSAAEFLSQPAFGLDPLFPGEVALKISLLNPENQVLSAFETPLHLNPGSSLDLSFRLDLDADAQPQVVLQGIQTRPPETASQPAPPTETSSAQPPPNTATAPQPAPSTEHNGSGSKPSGPVYELNPRILEQGTQHLLVLWQAPPQQAGVVGYQLKLNGQMLSENHPLANYRLDGLNSSSSYQIEIFPRLADGSLLPSSAITGQTLSAGGGGGGGGSGGGTSIILPSVAPRIERIQASRTSVQGLGYPVKLTAILAQGQTLPAGAYSWSCHDCGDASFSASTGPQVVWTAPSTRPGPYTVTLTVNDGIHPAVSQTLTLTVQHTLVHVEVIGAYQ